ncbi:MAG: hypothetical protein K2X01_01955 [Cyanobacteria bacterium]|nr:hypothetical protein [Cyanobacteriota bacterium]
MGSCGGNNQFSFNARFVSNSGFTQISGGDNCGPAFCPPQIVFAEPFCDDRPQAVMDAFDLAQGNASASEIVGVDLNAPQGRGYSNQYDRYRTNNPWLDDVMDTAYPQHRRDLGGQMVLQSQQMMQQMSQMMQQMMQMFMQLMSMMGLGGQQQGQLQAQQQQQQQEQQLREQNQQTIQQLQQRIAEIAAAISQLTQAGAANGQNAQAVSALQAENQQLKAQLAALQQGQSAPVNNTPAPVAPAQPAPVNNTPAPVAPAQPAPVNNTPAPVAPAQPAPVNNTPAPVVPAQPAPVNNTPAPVVPAQPVPVNNTPAPVVPAQPAPVQPAPVTVSQSDVETALTEANQKEEATRLARESAVSATEQYNTSRFYLRETDPARREGIIDNTLSMLQSANGGKGLSAEQAQSAYQALQSLNAERRKGSFANNGVISQSENTLRSLGFNMTAFNGLQPNEQNALQTAVGVLEDRLRDRKMTYNGGYSNNPGQLMPDAQAAVRNSVLNQLTSTGNSAQVDSPDAMNAAALTLRDAEKAAQDARNNATQLAATRTQQLSQQIGQQANQPYASSADREADINASLNVYNNALNQMTSSRNNGNRYYLEPENFGKSIQDISTLFTGPDAATIKSAEERLTNLGFNVDAIRKMNPRQVATLNLTLQAIGETGTRTPGQNNKTIITGYNETNLRARLYGNIPVAQQN